MKFRCLYAALMSLLFSIAAQGAPKAAAKPAKENVIYSLVDRIKKAQQECSQTLTEDGNVLAYDLYGVGDEKGNLTFRLGKQKVVMSTYGRLLEIKRVLRILRYHTESRMTDKLRTVHCTGLRIAARRLNKSMSPILNEADQLDYSELIYLSLKGYNPTEAGSCLSNYLENVLYFSTIARPVVGHLLLSVTLSLTPMDTAMSLYPKLYWKLVQQWYHLRHSTGLQSPYDEPIQAEVVKNAVKYPNLVPYAR